MVGRYGGWISLVLALACGGTTTNADSIGAAGATSIATGDGTTGGSTTGGGTTGGDPQDGDAAAEDFPVAELPWFATALPPGAEVPKVMADGGRDGVLYISLHAASKVDVNTHMHMMDFGAYSRVQFDARASREVEVLVSITRIDTGFYWEDASTGLAWQVATVLVGTEWKSYDVALSDMAAVAAGTSEPLGDPWGSAIHFLVQTTDPVEIWIDETTLVADPP